MIGQNVARASQSGLRTATLLGRRTMVTQQERWTLETARNAGSYIEGPNKVQLSNVVPNIEASWKSLSKEEQYGVFRQLEELQRKDWKELSIDEKKAGKYLQQHHSLVANSIRQQGIMRGSRFNKHSTCRKAHRTSLALDPVHCSAIHALDSTRHILRSRSRIRSHWNRQQ